VLKQSKSVVPALQVLAKTSRNLLARFHAMWTLEGLDALKPALVRQLMEDPQPRMRTQAIRASETLYKAGDRSFATDYAKMTKDPNVDVVIQALLTINRWKVPDAAATTKATMERNQARGVELVATTVATAAANASGGRGRGALTPEQQGQLERGGQIYNELCFACHGTDAMGTPKPELATTMAPPLAGSPRVNAHRDYIVKVVLRGLAGSVDGKTYTDMMIPMDNNSDEWIAAVGSFVRNSFGNGGGFITPADVARVRAATADRKTLWTLPELTASLPTPLYTDGWKLTASHNSDAAIGALSLTAWNAGVPQQEGMWFQIELPKPQMVTEVQFQSPPPGGRGGAGNAAAVTSSGAPVAGPSGFPRGYKVEVSTDGVSWTDAAQVTGTGTPSVATFAPVQAKFVRLSLTTNAEDTPPWSIQVLQIYAIQQPVKRTSSPSSVP
jgi:mono/diheme cytochrome c family protein